MCRTLGWAKFPVAPKEWQRWHAPLKVHDFTLLAKWSGYEARLIAPPYTRIWDEVCEWTPEARYELSGRQTRPQALSMLRSTRALTDLLNPR